MQNQRSKMITKSIPIRSSRNSLDPNQSLQEGFGSGVEIVPDTFDEPHKKKRQCIGTSETDMELDACIVCEVADKCVSRCCGIDCPVSFHQECLDAELGGGSEDLENPFCPYCWFKIVALKSKALRDEAIDAEKTVLKYLDKEVESRDEVTESVPEFQEDTNEGRDRQHSGESTDIVSGQGEKEKATPQSKEKQVQVFDKDSDKSRLIDQPDGDKGKLEVNEASEDIEDDVDDKTVEDQMKVAGRKGNVSTVLSMQESYSGKEDDQVQEIEDRRRRRRRLILNAADSERNGEEDVTAKVNSKDAGKKRDVAPVLSTQVQQNENQRRRRRRWLILNDTDSEFSSTKERNREEEEEVTKEITSSTKVTKSKTVAREISFFNKDQRRRLLWTPEEEEMLKVGVEKFAAEAKRNMPWRKVLEMGENVFHETRTPADLKDKWRNMIRLGKVEY